MITFKSYLTEARMAPLYHGTSSTNIYDIFYRNKGILPRTRQSNKKLLRNKDDSVSFGVSTTRNFRFASVYSSGENVVIELDQEKLSHSFKIIPVQYWQSDEKSPSRPKDSLGTKLRMQLKMVEYEEFIISKIPIPLKYIKRIYIPTHLVDSELFRTIAKDYGTEFVRTYSSFRKNFGEK